VSGKNSIHISGYQIIDDDGEEGFDDDMVTPTPQHAP